MKCTNIVIHSVACTNRTTLIESTRAGSYENLQLISLLIKHMTKTLISTCKITMKSLNNMDHSKENRSSVKAVKDIAALVLPILLIFALSLTLLFIQWIKHTVQKRIDRIEKDVDDITYELA